MRKDTYRPLLDTQTQLNPQLWSIEGSRATYSIFGPAFQVSLDLDYLDPPVSGTLLTVGTSYSKCTFMFISSDLIPPLHPGPGAGGNGTVPHCHHS
jgi:hypothetical protein